MGHNFSGCSKEQAAKNNMPIVAEDAVTTRNSDVEDTSQDDTKKPQSAVTKIQSAHGNEHVKFRTTGGVDPEAGNRSEAYQHSASVAIRKLVEAFYNKVLADDRLKPFYEGADMEKIFQSQMRVFKMMFDEEDLTMDQIKGVDLRKIHLRLLLKMGCTLDHWRMFVELFEQTLDEFPEVSPEARQRACELMRKTAHMFRPVEPGELEAYGLGPDGCPLVDAN